MHDIAASTANGWVTMCYDGADPSETVLKAVQAAVEAAGYHYEGCEHGDEHGNTHGHGH